MFCVLDLHVGKRTLSAYEVAYNAAGGRSGAGKLLTVTRPTLFETPLAPGQMRLFGLAEGSAMTAGSRRSDWKTTPPGGRDGRWRCSKHSSRSTRSGAEIPRSVATAMLRTLLSRSGQVWREPEDASEI